MIPRDDRTRYETALKAAKAGDYARARQLLKGWDHPKARALLAKVNEKDTPKAPHPQPLQNDWKDTPKRSWKRVALVVAFAVVIVGLIAMGLLMWASSQIEIEDPYRERLVDACVVEGQLTRSACGRWADDALETYRVERCVLTGDELWFNVLNCAENMGAELP